MERIKKTVYKNKEILIVDYSDYVGEAMLPTFEQVNRLLLTEKKRYPILTVFNHKSHMSRNMMRIIEQELPKVDEFVSKRAVIGISQIQMWILKGLNLWYKRQVYYFDSMEKALEYLAKDETASDQRT